MFKAIILLTRRADLTHEGWASWWLEAHAPLAVQLPGVRRIVFNVVDAGPDGSVDGISELWFDTEADFDAAYATEIGRATAADSLAHGSSRVRLIVTPHTIVGDDEG